MATLAVPTSAKHHRARTSGKYVFGGPTAPTVQEDVASASSQTSKSSTSPPTDESSAPRRDRKRQSLPRLEPIPVQKPPPLRRRSSPSPFHEMMKPVAKRMTKNYKHLVHDFNLLKKYAKQPDGAYIATTMCVFCEAATPRLVFFPCQHRCVCDRCLSLNDITSEPTSASSWTACPVCMSDIKQMLPHTGNEEELYWRWALDARPMLPLHFKDEFKEAGRRIQRAASAVRPEPMPNDEAAASRSLPSPRQPPSQSPRKLVASPSRITAPMHSLRQFLLAARRGSTAASSTQSTIAENNSKCSIL